MKIWIKFITDHFKGRAIIIPGGGLFANHIRSVQKNYNLEDDIAHDMALYSMSQMGLLISSIDRTNLHFCKTKNEIDRVIAKNKVPIIGTFDFLKKRIDSPNKNWSITSDSMALLISEELQLNTVLIVKSCWYSFINSKIALNQPKVNKLVSLGILDASFSLNFQKSKTKVYLFFRDQLPNASDTVLAFSKPSKRNQ
ncbi:MAG: hypothetical protein EVA26_03405 [Burkholderiaceae bacterium]|nr:MAG: hypothetical protein EVA26_03405 [Burkholderiaceae bacterium]